MKDYEEIVHAHWIFNTKNWIAQCSFCGQPIVTEVGIGYPRCCNCGSFMDEPDEYKEIDKFDGTIVFQYHDDIVSACYDFHPDIVGYGKTKSEAKNDLIKKINDKMEDLK